MEMDQKAQPPAYPAAGTPAQQPPYAPPGQQYAHPQSPPVQDSYAQHAQQQQYVQQGYVQQQQPGQQQYVQHPQQAYAQPGVVGTPPVHGASPVGSPPPGQPQMAYQQPGLPHQQSNFSQASQSQFKTAVPVGSLGPTAAPVDCPSCHQRAMTNVQHVSGDCTHLWALGFCLVICLPCIPYLIDSFKDVQHKCGKCGVTLATFKRSGGTQVHVFA